LWMLLDNHQLKLVDYGAGRSGLKVR
jgi:hypothetical protein